MSNPSPSVDLKDKLTALVARERANAQALHSLAAEAEPSLEPVREAVIAHAQSLERVANQLEALVHL